MKLATVFGFFWILIIGGIPSCGAGDGERRAADGSAGSDGDSDGDTDSDTDGDSDGDGDADGDSDQDVDTVGDSDTDGDSDGDGDADGDSDQDVDTVGDSDTDGDSDGDADGDGDTDMDGDTDTDVDGDGDTGSEAPPDTETDTSIDGGDGDGTDTDPGAGSFCTYASQGSFDDVVAAYNLWKETVVTSDGAGGYLRIWKPDSGTVIGSTVSEGIGYGMIIAVYMDDQDLFDNLWQYEQLHLNGNGLMNWEIGPDGNVTSGGSGAATDGDEDMAWALVMADRKWGGSGSLDEPYLDIAVDLIDRIWTYEVDQGRDYMLRPGDSWGDVDVTNPSYFAPAYYKVFAEVTGNDEWHRVVDSSYDIINRSLTEARGNAENGLVPAWCDSNGNPVEAYGGAPTHYQHDSTRTPFRVGQDYCYFGEPRAKAYMEKITSFFLEVGVASIGDGYDLDGTPHPLRTQDGGQAASFVGPAGVGAMYDVVNQDFIDEAYAAVNTLELTAGTIYYEKCWAVLSLFMLDGELVDLTGTGAGTPMAAF